MQQVTDSSFSLQETARTEDRVCCSKHWLWQIHSHKHTHTHAHTQTSTHSGSGWWRLLSNCLVQTNRLASLPSLVSMCLRVNGGWGGLTSPALSHPPPMSSMQPVTVTKQWCPCPMSASSRKHWRLDCERGACIYVCMCVYLLKRSLGLLFFFVCFLLLINYCLLVTFPTLRQPSWLRTH